MKASIVRKHAPIYLGLVRFALSLGSFLKSRPPNVLNVAGAMLKTGPGADFDGLG
jgi:hypothetical protein